MEIAELKNIITKDLRKIGISLSKEEKNKIISFEKQLYSQFNIYIDGDFYVVDTLLDKGEIKKASSKNYKDALYIIYRYYAFILAKKYERNNRIHIQDQRIILFNERLNLLKKIDDYYYQKEKKYIDEVLIKHPFK